MDTLEIALLLSGLLIFLLAGGMWIAVALGLVAWFGVAFFTRTKPEINIVTSLWNSGSALQLASLPLFIWMGEILYRTKLSEQMFAGLSPWLNWLPGRLMHVNVLGCGIFGAVSGSSAATTATIAKIALPELLKRGYHEGTALGSLSGAGTLGILIPPSITMVVYAVAADVSIVRIFLAGFIPGFLLMAMFSGYIMVWSLLNPALTPPRDAPTSLKAKLSASRQLIPVLLLTFLVFYVLIAGLATANEAAAYGVLGSLLLAATSRSLTWKNFWESVNGATRLSCMIMFILGAAAFLSVTMGFTGIPKALAEWVAGMNLSPYTLMAMLTLIYVLLGTALDGVSMIVLTTSIVIPMVQKAGFDPVWFGIFIVLLVEIAEVTPPVGFNLFVLQNMSGRDSMTVARASLPFFFLMVAAVGLIVVFPGIVTWLPQIVMGK
jgi:tripartite ATP-independent transporter DctM subunit